MKNFIKFGNHKLGNDTAIFNMGTSIDCPARLLKMCDTINKGYKCYARKPEIQYGKNVINFRRNQGEYWSTTEKHEILCNISKKIKARRKPTKFLRFNESGEFNTQSDIKKLSYIAEGVKPLGITTYGYSSRYDLDFTDVSFIVKGSGHSKCPNGRTTVIGKTEPVPEGYIVCPGSCKHCNLCKIDVPHNIAFRVH